MEFNRLPVELKRLFQIDQGKTASAARILSPNPTRLPLPCLLSQSFFYGYMSGFCNIQLFICKQKSQKYTVTSLSAVTGSAFVPIHNIFWDSVADTKINYCCYWCSIFYYLTLSSCIVQNCKRKIRKIAKEKINKIAR